MKPTPDQIAIQATIQELEVQRAFLATSAAQKAGEIAVLKSIIEERDAKIAELEKAGASLSQPPLAG